MIPFIMPPSVLLQIVSLEIIAVSCILRFRFILQGMEMKLLMCNDVFYSVYINALYAYSDNKL